MRIKRSDYEIPFHIQEEIMKRLLVKSLIRFRSVSKAWKSLIDSSEFIIAHNPNSPTQQQHLLVSYGDVSVEEDYVFFCRSYKDDGTYPQQMPVPTLPPPIPAGQIIRPRVVGSSRGLVCLCGLDPSINTHMALLWMPSIRKSIIVALPALLNGFGFGVCPVTNDPKMVTMTVTHSSWSACEFGCLSEVMVYTLSSRKWRRLSNNLPTTRLRNWCLVVVTERFIYWHAKLPSHNTIMSFDVTNENLEVIDLPGTLVDHDFGDLCISKLRESLVMLQNKENIYTVWMMEHGAQRSFTKLFNITTTEKVVGFTRNGVPIMKVTDDDDGESKLVYEPNSEQNHVLDTSGSPYAFDVTSYVETLLLHGLSDCISY